MIRPYKTEDKERLIEIFKRNTPEYFDVTEVNDFEAYLHRCGHTYFTVEYDNNIVGGAGYYVKKSDRSGRITWIFFHPDYSGLGLGKKVMKHCLGILSADPVVEKLVVATSQLAYGFFEKFGYTLIKIEKAYWGPELDLYLMEQPKKHFSK